MLTTIVKLTCEPCVNVPFFGVFTTASCAGGGVQLSDPESCACNPPSAVASVIGLGWDWQAATGVVLVLVTVTMTELWGAIVPKLQFRLLLFVPESAQLPCVAVAVAQLNPRYTVAYCSNLAGTIGKWHDAELCRTATVAFEDHQIAVVKRASAHPHQDLLRPGPGILARSQHDPQTSVEARDHIISAQRISS